MQNIYRFIGLTVGFYAIIFSMYLYFDLVDSLDFTFTVTASLMLLLALCFSTMFYPLYKTKEGVERSASNAVLQKKSGFTVPFGIVGYIIAYAIFYYDITHATFEPNSGPGFFFGIVVIVYPIVLAIFGLFIGLIVGFIADLVNNKRG